MHSSTVSSSSVPAPSITTTNNIEQYPYPPISTLRRPSRPSNINLSLFDHNNTQQGNDPAIYSAPICYMKPPNGHQQNFQQAYTATFQYQHRQEQHMQLPGHNHNMQLCPPQQQSLLDQYGQQQHTPHTFPLQASPTHNHPYFYFPPSSLQTNPITNGHQNASPHNNHLHAVQMQEQQQPWSNPVLSPLLVKRMNENAISMSIDDDEDPSGAIDALVADVDSNSDDLLNDQANKSIDESKVSSITAARTISPSEHLYLRGNLDILRTPPNPLASDDHLENQLTMGNNFQKPFSPISSAGFELTTSNNNNGKISSSANSRAETSFFTFENNSHHDDDDNLAKPLFTKSNVRTAKVLIQDENSNQSSTTSSGYNSSSRIFNQMLQPSAQRRSSSTSPLSNDIKSSPLDPTNNNQTNINSGQNRHLCMHPDCNKLFANKSALAKHKLTHSEDRKHKCPICNKGFKRLDHLHGHTLTHKEEKPHKCRVPDCNRNYCDARSLKRHIENVHQDILAAIHEGTHNEYRTFLPSTATVKTKNHTTNTELSFDSLDSNSPHSLNDTEQPLTIRPGIGTKLMTMYTFDEEKCVECQICKKPFKNAAALNGHMRLHGGFNEIQPSSSSTDPSQKKKRSAPPKRKRTDSPSSSVLIKREEQEISSLNNPHHPTSFATPQPSFDMLKQHSHEPSRVPSFSQYTMQNPLNVQLAKPPSRMANVQTFPNTEHYSNKYRKSFPSENILPTGQNNGMFGEHSYLRAPVHYQEPAASTNLLQHMFRQKGELPNPDFHFRPQPPSSFNESIRSTPSPNYHRSFTPVVSPYSNLITSHSSPISILQSSNNNHAIHSNGTHTSPATQSTSLSCSSSSSSHTAPKKRILNAMKQISREENPAPIVEELPPAVLEIVPDPDSPVKNHMSGFLIGTPSSTGTSSSSSTSSHPHFTYEEPPPVKQRDSTPSSFQWPSQFRRQLSLNNNRLIINPVPSTPYTPPPMLSPFRKGPGLYYRVFSQPGPSTETPSIPTTPNADESNNPKINIGREYQAIIPKLRIDLPEDHAQTGDELLFSPYELTSLDEKSLEKFEQLKQINPFLFSPRHSPASYSLELVYMLLHEYNGDIQRTLSALLEGTAKDIKQCRPLHRYRFAECDTWTKEEIEAFTTAIQSSEKNFELVSRAVGTKSVKQCIEFHYMPKVNLTPRKISVKPTSSVMTRRKRFQMMNAKQRLDDETSSSSFNELPPAVAGSNNSHTTQFFCDIDECSQTFTTDRACRAHRKQHRRTKTTIKPSRPMDSIN